MGPQGFSKTLDSREVSKRTQDLPRNRGSPPQTGKPRGFASKKATGAMFLRPWDLRAPRFSRAPREELRVRGHEAAIPAAVHGDEEVAASNPDVLRPPEARVAPLLPFASSPGQNKICPAVIDSLSNQPTIKKKDALKQMDAAGAGRAPW